MTGRNDAFSSRHPAVNFAFFVLVIGFGVAIQHPAYLLAGVGGGTAYLLLLKGIRGFRQLGMMIPLLILVAVLNPIVNTRGEQVLFYLLGRPYTFEALLYGMAVAGALAVMLIWFGCYNLVMTGDKFTSLFGSLIPSLSLLLVMVLRLVPSLSKKAAQLSGARRSIGKAAGAQAPVKEKLLGGFTLLSALVSWALEGGIVTGDSMRSRGYGSRKRTSFMVYRMKGLDWLLLAFMLVLAAITLVFALGGSANAEYMPELTVAPLSGSNFLGFLCYCLLLLLPTGLHIKEAIQWHISRSKI